MNQKVSALLLGSVMVLQASLADSATQPARRQAARQSSGGQSAVASPFQSTGNETYDKFMRKLVNAPPGDMDAFLQQLKGDPDFFQDIKTKSVFYASKSRHESSPEYPRALIMYGNSDLIVTFNGSPQQKLYGAMEIAGYNRNAGKLEFREITFKADASPEQMASNNSDGRSEFDFENRNVMVRKANSNKCTMCHNDPEQPIFGTYLAWPGSYGSYEESFAQEKPRYASSDHAFEYNKLQEFRSKAYGMKRYGQFYWGQAKASSLEISSTLFAIALNYRMAHSAMMEALSKLSQPDNQKYRFAFAGYLLNCDGRFLRDESKTSQIARELYSKRYDEDVRNRRAIEKDHEANGDTLRWSSRYPIPVASRANATTARPGSAQQFAKLENLFNLMHADSGKMYLAGSGGSWDGYNQSQDFMTDYFDKYYGLQSTTYINQKAAEKSGGFAAGQERADLLMPLRQADFDFMKPKMDALQLPAMPAGGAAQLCQQLSAASLQATGN